jgi:tetratricopeptide (TPR) repeat protein
VEAHRREWGGVSSLVLNNYVPPAIAPQIRWAFGMDKFEIAKHTAELAPSRVIDLHLALAVRPAPAEAVLARRAAISAIYRNLASSHVVLITLGLIEAWFDRSTGLYINCTPPRGVCRAEPDRFELHILSYEEVAASLSELLDLLGEVCPRGHRVILTLSPVPLTATFTTSDVAIANSYSKSVLRAAIEPLLTRDNVDYFPSYESVVLTDRSIAFGEDQVHVEGALVRFNVDRMIAHSVTPDDPDGATDAISRARDDSRTGLFRAGLARLQQSWSANPGDPSLAVALGRALFRAGNEAAAEALLITQLDRGEDAAVRTLLAHHYNEVGRYEEAALHAEKACELGKMRLTAALERAIAYFHLEQFEEGLAVLERAKYPLERRPLLAFWKARFNERLGRFVEAEKFYLSCTGETEDVQFMAAFAEFLANRGRWPEAAEWVDRILLLAPNDKDALRLRVEVRRRRLGATSRAPGRLDSVRRWSSGLMRRAWRRRGLGPVAGDGS